MIETAVGALHDLGKPRVEKRMGRIQHGTAEKAPGGNRLGNHVSRRTIESGLLTPTLKIKRNQVVAKFEQEINKLYDGH